MYIYVRGGVVAHARGQAVKSPSQYRRWHCKQHSYVRSELAFLVHLSKGLSRHAPAHISLVDKIVLELTCWGQGGGTFATLPITILPCPFSLLAGYCYQFTHSQKRTPQREPWGQVSGRYSVTLEGEYHIVGCCNYANDYPCQTQSNQWIKQFILHRMQSHWRFV